MRLFRKICYRCGQASLTRIKRLGWMHLLPSSKHYRCYACGIHFISLFGKLVIQIGREKRESEATD